jgi:hypothetical protein
MVLSRLKIAFTVIFLLVFVLLITVILFPILYFIENNKNNLICTEEICTSQKISLTEINEILTRTTKSTFITPSRILNFTSVLVDEVDTSTIFLTGKNIDNLIDFTLIRNVIPPVSSNIMNNGFKNSDFTFFLIGRIPRSSGYGIMNVDKSNVVYWNISRSTIQPLFQEEIVIGSKHTPLPLNTMLYTLKEEPICFLMDNFGVEEITVCKANDIIGSDWNEIKIKFSQKLYSLPSVVQTVDLKLSGLCVVQYDSELSANLIMCVSSDNFFTVKKINVFIAVNISNIDHFTNSAVVLSNDEVFILTPTSSSLNLYWSLNLNGPYSIKQNITVPSLIQGSVFMGLFENDVIAIFGQSFEDGSNYLTTSEDNFVTFTDNIFTPRGETSELQIYFMFLPGGERRIYTSTQNYSSVLIQNNRDELWVETEICKTGKHSNICVQQYSQTQPCALVAIQPKDSPVCVQLLGSLDKHVIKTATTNG